MKTLGTEVSGNEVIGRRSASVAVDRIPRNGGVKTETLQVEKDVMGGSSRYYLVFDNLALGRIFYCNETICI